MMTFNLTSLIVGAAFAAASIAPLTTASSVSAAPVGRAILSSSIHTAARTKCGSPSEPCPTCTIEISTIALSPAVTSDGSGGNILFSGPEPTEAKCDREAIQQWNNALSTGWSPANRCTIISPTYQYDEVLTEITYVYNNGPSVRTDGYAVMCNHATNVSGVGPY